MATSAPPEVDGIFHYESVNQVPVEIQKSVFHYKYFEGKLIES